MIDMRLLYEHNDYQNALDKFNNNSPCQWNFFKNVHLLIAKDRCPICECKIDETETRLGKKDKTIVIKATIDHYRPVEYYDFLKCDHKNYLLMCSDCNNIYKKSNFKICSSTIKATKTSEIEDEKPLIVNPINDNIYELFDLVFKISSAGQKILELKAKNSTGYLYEKAIETIKLFGLGNCEINKHSNDNVHNCRIRVLENHFGIFYEFAKALKEKNRTKAFLELKEKKEIFEEYGFLEFIKRKQFIIAI